MRYEFGIPALSGYYSLVSRKRHIIRRRGESIAGAEPEFVDTLPHPPAGKVIELQFKAHQPLKARAVDLE